MVIPNRDNTIASARLLALITLSRQGVRGAGEQKEEKRVLVERTSE